MSQQQQESGDWNHKDSMGLLYLAANAMAACVTPFLRIRPGRESPGVAGLLALIIIVGWAGFGKAPEMLTYLVVWLVAVAIMRIGALSQYRHGYVHSRYSGWPWLKGLLPHAKETTVKGIVEPFLCFIVGALLCEVSQPLGHFIVAAGIGVMVSTGIEVQVVRRQMMQARDAQIEMRAYAERLRGQRDDF